MKVDIVRIGNSQGVRIPKPLLEACGLSGTVDLEVEDGRLVLTPAKTARAGWAESFKAMAENGDDALLIDDNVSPTPEGGDWQW